MRSLAAAALLSLLAAPPPAPAPAPAGGEAMVSVDVKDADIRDIVLLMAEVGQFQVVIDPGVACKLTLKLKDVPWDTALDLALRSCGLGSDADNGIYRIAPTAKLAGEMAERRRFEEERRLFRPLRTVRYRLSYARAAELAPLVKKFLSPRGDVVFDPRTNTLYITDID
ncbi:MAG TPA: secretin N-terminal domain-containing protein [Vicinamibacteria bacterium]